MRSGRLPVLTTIVSETALGLCVVLSENRFRLFGITPADQRKLGLSEPMRTLPLSLVAAGVGRAVGKAGLSEPMRTLPLSSVWAGGGRTAGKAGLSEPMRTLPLSRMAAVAAFISI